MKNPLRISPRFAGYLDNRLLLANAASPTAWTFARDRVRVAAPRSVFRRESLRESPDAATMHLSRGPTGRPKSSASGRFAQILRREPAASKTCLRSPRLWRESPDRQDGALVWAGARRTRHIL